MGLFQSPEERENAVEQLRSIAAPIFAATLPNTGKGDVLVVHVSSVPQRKMVAFLIVSALGGATKVRFHSPASLTAPRSLERLVKRLGRGEIIYDPTQALSRAKALVDGGSAVRASLGDKLGGLFYAPRQRALYVALNSKRLAAGDKVKVAELAAIEHSILAALTTAFAGQETDCPAVRVGFGLPRAELVAVDQRSVASWNVRAAQAVRRYWKPAAIAAMLGFGVTGTAVAKDPAVSQTNLKVTGVAGTAADESAWVVGGALTLPVGQSWGIQVEGAGAGIDDDTAVGVAGHIFTRDPDKYLLGLFAAYASEDQFDLDATRIGAEAEIYLNQISLLAKAGYQFSDTVGDGFVGDVELKWYLSDNLALSGGVGIDENTTQGHGSVEWMPGFSALPGLAFRVDGAFGDNDYESILGGLTYYFGADASLKDRHRKQDPESALFGLFKAVEQERQEQCAIYGCGP